MKKSLKIFLIFLSVFMGIILLDSLQALVFNHNPIIGIETKGMVKKGLLVNTYHCTKGKNITKFRSSSDFPETVCREDSIYSVTNVDNVNISISDISLTGATITIKDTNETPYVYGEWYLIQKEEDGKWKDLETIIDNYGFNDIGYIVNESKEVKFLIDWKWLYGELSFGRYRLLKEVSNKYIAIEFDIASTLEETENLILMVDEKTITSKGATFILVNNSNEDYAYEQAYYIEKKEKMVGKK